MRISLGFCKTWRKFLEKRKLLSSLINILPYFVVFPKVFGLENHAYCYHHLKENFSSFFSKQKTKRNTGKKNALQFLDSIAYARLEHDYNVSMYELWKYNDALATWVEDNALKHCAMSKFPKQRWDKMTTNLVESFNVWLRNERHHSIWNFLMEHMAKLGPMLVKHKE